MEIVPVGVRDALSVSEREPTAISLENNYPRVINTPQSSSSRSGGHVNPAVDMSSSAASPASVVS